MTEITMYDATSAPRIPLNPANLPANVAVASYSDGAFAAGWIGCVHRFPTLAKDQLVVSIATRLTSVARIMDVEPGNPTHAAAVPGWIKAMISHGVYRPGAYADRSDMPGIVADLAASGLKRNEYVLWLADPDATAIPPGFDAVQNRFMGAFDSSLVLPAFFPSSKPTPPPPTPDPPVASKASGTATFAGELNFETGAWEIHGTPDKKAHFGTDSEMWSAQIQVGNHDGKWRAVEMPFNAEPLGGP